MKRYGARGPLSDPPQLGESVVVLAWEAEAAIATVAEAAVEQIIGSDEDTRAALTEAFQQGQREMLAKCIAATESLHFPTDYGEWYGIEAMKGTLVCEHCNDNCHSQSGVTCDSPDALWPCETITVLRALQEKQ